ncbi:ATP-dependent endonuclease [Citrobacter sp. RHBSTW-00976]|uniref:ATP-dependent endonuclease n=1 Tax=Citrobacter sp. RHBSTW-00976 TaxID=2742674 RepID=UPI0015E9C928|nr:ATP-dependent endonuclease [Citrobacter sp. RHBSTW-00976]QLR64687.1 ATP-dependent endonuclease [Citrobacter sp. RHBSTW-00976]
MAPLPAKNVILIEGDAEEILIPHLVKNSFGVTLDELGVSLISVRGTGFELLSSLFHPSRITKKCAILTDDDINIYNEDKPEYITQVMYDDAISSEKSGKERVEALKLLTANNNLLKAYFTKHTFEIDLALSGSKKYFEIIARESFEKDFYLTPYLDAFQSSDDTKIGSFALKLANKHKKGWFAMKVVEKLDHNFPIPMALCKALGFTSDFNKLTLARVIKYRCDYYTKTLGDNIIEVAFSDDSLEYIVDNIEPVLDIFKGHYSNDPLVHLLMEA